MFLMCKKPDTGIVEFVNTDKIDRVLQIGELVFRVIFHDSPLLVCSIIDTNGLYIDSNTRLNCLLNGTK